MADPTPPASSRPWLVLIGLAVAAALGSLFFLRPPLKPLDGAYDTIKAQVPAGKAALVVFGAPG